MITTISLANMRRPLLVFYPETSWLIWPFLCKRSCNDDIVRLMFIVILYFTDFPDTLVSFSVQSQVFDDF